MRLQIRNDQIDQLWIWILVGSLTFGDERQRYLVHLAFPDRAGQRIDSYLLRVASRSQSAKTDGTSALQKLLTPRELELLELLAYDCSVDAIARILSISISTVRNHVRNIHKKLQIQSTAEAVARFLVEPLRVTGPGRDGHTIELLATNKLEPGHDIESACSSTDQHTAFDSKRCAPCMADFGKSVFEYRACIARALAHPRRLIMLEALGKRDLCVYELAALAGVNSSAACRHLALLKHCGLVTARRDGARTSYSATCSALGELEALMRPSWNV